jgi:hypothetical protein
MYSELLPLRLISMLRIKNFELDSMFACFGSGVITTSLDVHLSFHRLFC